jgi:hypothetical protein
LPGIDNAEIIDTVHARRAPDDLCAHQTLTPSNPDRTSRKEQSRLEVDR